MKEDSSRSKHYLMTLLILAAILFALALGIWSPELLRLIFGRPSGVPRARFTGANSQLQRVYWDMEGEIERRRGFADSNALESVVISLADLYIGYDWFRLAGGTNHVLVAINPDAALWQNPNAHQNEVAAYWPERLLNFQNGVTGFVGICFGGRNIFLTNLPPWTPFPLQTLATSTPARK